MKKVLLITCIFFLLAAGFSWYYYKKQLPKVVAKAIVKNEYPAYIPEKIQEKVVEIRDTINIKIEKFITITDTAGVTTEKIINMIDEINEEDVRKAISIIQSENIDNVEQVFDLLAENIPVQTFDVELLREAFLKNVKMRHVNRGLSYLRTHNIMETVDAEVARETIKQIIIQKEEELRSRGILKD